MKPLRPLLCLTLLLALVATPVHAAPAAAPPEPAMFYHATEGLKTLAVTHFTSDLTALIAEYGLGGLGITTAINVYAREGAQRFATQERALPGLGCYTRAARTQAQSQSQRHSTMEAHYEFLCRYADSVVSRTHAELAGEVLVKLVDRFRTIGNGIEGGGEEDKSVLIDIDGAGPADGLEFYEDWVHLVAPIWDTDTAT